LDTTTEKYTIEIGQCTKSMKVMEITMQNLQNGVATDLSDVREEVRNDVSKMKMEVSDCRTTSSRSCASNESAIQAVASEINPLRNFRELILERLHIEKFVNLVREWQTTTIPQVAATSKDLDDRMKKVQNSMAADHQTLIDVTRSVSEVRRHFKMFYAIASGLDDKPNPGVIGDKDHGSADDRLPPLTSSRVIGGGGDL